MNAAEQNPLTAVLELSRRMLQQAEAGDWEDVIRQEAERGRLIEQTFPLSQELAGLPSTAEILEQIIACDNQVMELGVQAQGEARGMLSKLQKGRRATQAYQKF
jgi:hypothetical protein